QELRRLHRRWTQSKRRAGSAARGRHRDPRPVCSRLDGPGRAAARRPRPPPGMGVHFRAHRRAQRGFRGPAARRACKRRGHCKTGDRMIFMSQSGLTDAARASAWDAWYVEHLNIMVSVPGISSAQRFRALTGGCSPSLAMYSIASPNVFHDPYYLSVRGMGEWLSLIDKRYYRRNLFDGLERAPEVGPDELLLVADREAPAPNLGGVEWMWLDCVGIDRSTPCRGIAVVSAQA